MAKAIMIQGTGSNVGKSILVAGLARAFTRRGMKVAPFKPQNMSNNAAVTQSGGEIGRAQALQALAAGIEPTVDMNPILLKPENETGAQIIVQGKWSETMSAAGYTKVKPKLLTSVMESFNRVSRNADLVLIEGAGSPAEVNLRKGDIANMGFALAADIPVILAGDIDRGGVIAQIVGTHSVLADEDRNKIVGFCINKFRGDVSLFADGVTEIEKRTNWPCLGVIPWFSDATKLPAEDALDIRSTGSGRFKIAVPRLSRIANFDDLDPLAADPCVELQFVEPGQALPGDANLIILCGSKSTLDEMRFFKAQGWDIDLIAHLRRGGFVIGLCGGYQMLGKHIHDPDGIEGNAGTEAGLGLLDIETVMTSQKQVKRVRGYEVKGNHPVEGYEIHIGRTTGPDCHNPWLVIDDKPAGAVSKNGKVLGCYVHGMFKSDAFRAEFLADIGASATQFSYSESIEGTLDNLAEHLEKHLSLDQMLELTKSL